MMSETAPVFPVTRLWRWRYVILAISAAFAATAAVISALLPPIYEASAMLLVARPAVQAGAPPGPGNPGLQIGSVLAADLPTQTVAAFAMSRMIVSKIAATVYGGEMFTSAIRSRLTVRGIRNTDLIELEVRERDPARARQVATAWAGLVVEESQSLFATRAEQSYEFFAGRLQDAKERLESAEERLRRFRGTSELSVVQARVDAIVAQIAAYESRLVDLSVALQRLEAKLAQTESLVARTPRILTLSKSITTDPFLHQALADVEKKTLVELSRLQLTNQELNPVYVALDQSRVALAAEVAATRTEHVQTAEALRRLYAERAGLQRRLAQEQQLDTRLRREVDSMKQVYDILLQRREEAQVAARSDADAVRLVAEAALPDAPTASRLKLNVVLAALLGLTISSLWAIIWDSDRASISVTIPTSVAVGHASPPRAHP